MLPVSHVSQATLLRSLSSRRLINNIAVRHRLVLPPSCLHHPLQRRHYARLTEDAATEPAPGEKPSRIPGADSRGRFLCPFSNCAWAKKGFSRKANLERHVLSMHRNESEDTIAEVVKTLKETPRKPHKPYTSRKKAVEPEAQSPTETDAVLEPAPQTEPWQEEAPPTTSTLGKLLSALENNEPPRPRTRRRTVAEAEIHPEPPSHADKDAAPESTPRTETPTVETAPTTSTLGSLLGALGNEEPRKPRARRKRVTDYEGYPEAELAAEAEVLPEAGQLQQPQRPTSAEQQQPPPTPVKRKNGRPFGSKNKTPAKKDIGAAETEDTPTKRRGRRPNNPEPEPGYAADCVNTTYLGDALLDTGIWGKRKSTPSSAARAKQREMRKHADAMRVNIVSNKLCDDVLGYMKPGLLERHKGCDIIDINPGAGLWSRKLNDMLQPRRHILVEEDFGVYEPFLKPLVERKGTKVLEAPGVVWKELFDALGGEGVLPEQEIKQWGVEETPKRNDTLLVVMNLLTKSKKKKLGHSKKGSLTAMVLYQLMGSVRLQALFQRYGLVRMLVWVDDHEKAGYLPKTIQRRKLGAIQAELSTEWLTEVAGIDRPDDGKQYAYRRDNHIDMESMGSTLERMEEAGYKMPEGRETDLMKTYLEMEKEGNLLTAGEQSPHILTRYEGAEAMEALKKQKMKEGTWTRRDQNELSRNKWLNNQARKQQDELGDLLAKLDRLTELKLQIQEAEENNKPAALATEQFEELEAELEKAWEGFGNYSRARFLVARDNLRAFKQPPELGPVLLWDRRHIEPLAVKPEEFYPPCEGALLDIQPRSMESTLRAKCPHGSRVYDQLDLILRYLYLSASAPIGQVIDGVYHGARDGVADKTKSFHDVALGGSPLQGPIGGVNMRALNRTQIVEFIKRWQEWPFKPTFPELVGRLAESDEEPDPESGGGSTMLGNIAD